jgi:pilus assembly protein CpaC
MFAKQSFRAAILVSTLILLQSLLAAAEAQSASPRLSTATANPAEPQSIELQLGEQRVISSENVRSYSEGTRGIVDVRLTKDASQFIIVALTPGTTTLLFLMLDGSERHYRISVIDPNTRSRSGGNSGAVELKDNIRLDFYFVQVSKNYRHQIGIGWPGTVAPTFNATYNVQAGSLESATAVITNQALPRLDMGQSSGWAKIMRQAAVVTANGEKATLSGGGELNFAVQTALTSTLYKIPYGAVIDVLPQYDARSGRIELHLHADISELDAENGTGMPGRVTSNLDTQVNLELGQSLILAGLTAKSERRSKSGIPILSQIPILGVFFGSHAQVEADSENIVLIVPSVVDAVSMQDRERVAAALKSYTEFSGDMADTRQIPAAKPNIKGTPTPATTTRSQ